MGRFIRSILVEDTSGAHLILYEYQPVASIFRFRRKPRRLELGEGEPVESIDANNFTITSTGEKLTRAKPPIV